MSYVHSVPGCLLCELREQLTHVPEEWQYEDQLGPHRDHDGPLPFFAGGGRDV